MDSEILLNKANGLQIKYEKHFNASFPHNIVGWWDPVNIIDYPDELEKGVNQMEKDINKAIKTNTPLEEIPETQIDKIFF